MSRLRPIRRTAAVLGVLAGTVAFPVVASAQINDSVLRARLQQILKEEGLVGASWATVHPDGSIRTGSAGYRDNAGKLPFADSTRIHVGSVAKAVLATGILRLVTENRLALDDPVDRYLKTVSIDNHWARDHPVTVRHLLDHTSGLDDARLWQMFSDRVAHDAPLASAISRSADPLRVRVRPGSRLSYSNTGYTLLGMIVESVTGAPYEEYLDAQLLGPLGMRNSTFRFTTQEGPSADSTLAWGHLDEGQQHPATPIALRPAGQFTTTAHDLAVFARFLMGDGTVAGRPFIRADLMRARGQPSTTEAARAGLNAGYALGLTRRDRYGVVGFCHSGNSVGFVGLVCAYPQERKAFVIGINTDSESARYERLFDVLAKSLRVSASPTPATGAAAPDVSEWEAFYIPSPSRFQSFAYLDATFGVLRVREQDGRLILAPMQGTRRELRPVGGYLFAATDRTTTSHVLLREAGAYRIADGITTYQKVSLWYLGVLWISLVLGVLGMVWFLGAGIVALARFRGSAWRRPEIVPFAGVLALLLPLPLFLTQPFMRLGDLTPASALLAACTIALPVTMIVLLWRVFRSPQRKGILMMHAGWAIAVLQWSAVLAAWDLLPLRLWT